MTLKGTPHRRYSSVDPMCMPCPCGGSRSALVAAVARAFKKASLVRGQWVFLYWYANSGPFWGGWFVMRWWVSTSSRSVSPFCLTRRQFLCVWMFLYVEVGRLCFRGHFCHILRRCWMVWCGNLVWRQWGWVWWLHLLMHRHRKRWSGKHILQLQSGYWGQGGLE